MAETPRHGLAAGAVRLLRRILGTQHLPARFDALDARLGAAEARLEALRASADQTREAVGQILIDGQQFRADIRDTVLRQFGELGEAVGQIRADGQRFRAVYLGDRRLLVRLRHLPLVLIADAADRLIVPHLVQEGEYETEVTAWLLANLSETDVCFDVGANIGYHACIMARRASRGRVVAIEPDPDSFALLAENRDINWLEAVLRPRQLALADAVGELQLHRLRNRSANTSIGHPSAAATEPGTVQPAGSFTARCLTFDALAEAEGVVPDIIKIDVEGAELLVLRGARNTIAATPRLRILMEWSPAQLEAAGSSGAALLDEIAAQRLVVHRLRHDGGEEPAATRETMLNSPYWNVVLRHRPTRETAIAT